MPWMNRVQRSFIVLILSFILLFARPDAVRAEGSRVPWWPIQAIDTMKYSRDPSREKLNDSSFDRVIDEQIRRIAETGATHVAIGTPYDDEFLPMLARWVAAARKYNLNVWFRGNFSGWEKWFGYDRMGRGEHLTKTKAFILNHPTLFEDGDLFSSCPECENGGPGDPRHNGDLSGHRTFLISEYEAVQEAFLEIKKRVQSNLYSMNGDVARLVMDRDTTAKLDGIVTIDHYVKTPEQLVADIENIARTSGGRIVLGEFGAPIPDIHGRMSEQQQADWIEKALTKLSQSSDVIGVNYWTSTGGSTQLWTEADQSRKAVQTVTSYFRPKYLSGVVRDDRKKPIESVRVSSQERNAFTDEKGEFSLPYRQRPETLAVNSPDYRAKDVQIDPEQDVLEIELISIDVSWWKRILRFFTSLFSLRPK